MSLAAVSQSWAVSEADRRKFTLMFNNADRSKTGFLSAAEARPVLIKSDLNRDILRQIW